ncbi:photosystem I chlorophyll a/b-binding protein 5, chloroplastic [Tanacetum coccineum]
MWYTIYLNNGSDRSNEPVLFRVTEISDLPVWYEAGATKFSFASTRTLFIIQLLLMRFVETKRYNVRCAYIRWELYPGTTLFCYLCQRAVTYLRYTHRFISALYSLLEGSE